MIMATRPPFAESLKSWRAQRNLSQLDLALEANVSARHIAFLETGKSRPSREMVLQLAESLQLSLRARNEMLEQAGFARAFRETGLEGASLAPVRGALQHMLNSHAPYPAIICDRHWALVDANASAAAILAPLRGESAETNIVRLVLMSPVARQLILNWSEAAHDLASRLRLEIRRSGGDPVLVDLLAQAQAVLRESGGDGESRQREIRNDPFVPVRIQLPGRVLSLVSILAEFGTPRDITVADLRIELFFPTDTETEAFLRS